VQTKVLGQWYKHKDQQAIVSMGEHIFIIFDRFFSNEAPYNSLVL